MEKIPYGKRPEVKIRGDVPQEKKDIIQERYAQSFQSDHYRSDLFLESKELMERVEYKKSEREIDYINRANVSVNEIMADCGAVPFDIPEGNVYFLDESFFSDRFKDDRSRGLYFSNAHVIAVRGNPDQSALKKMAIALHESIHAKEFISVHASEEEYSTRREGMVRSVAEEGGGAQKKMGIGLNEAIVANLEKKLFGKILGESKFFEEELNSIKKNRELIKKAEEGVDRAPGDLFVYKQKGAKEEEFFSISYPNERRVLDQLIGGISSAGNMSPEEAEKLFYSAYFAGELSAWARIKVFTGKAFGEGAFDMVMQMTTEGESAKEVLEFLKSRQKSSLFRQKKQTMEKKIPVSSSPYEQLIPNRKKAVNEDPHPGFTEEEMIRNEAWHGVKKEEPKRLATVHSLDEARARKMTKQTGVDSVEATPLIVIEQKTATAAEMRESREREEKEIEAIAHEGFEKRIRGEGAEAIDAMLIEKGIKPWTPEAEEFMKQWDWEQAEQEFKKLASEREAAVVKANEAEPTKKIELREDQEKRVGEKFAAFNIDLDSLPKELKEEYETLTYGQRLLLAENLQQLTLGRVQEEAVQKYQDDTTQSKFLGKIWKGITKKYQVRKQEQATALDIKQGGLEYHGELLKQLVEGTKRTGLDAIEGKNGSLELQYVESHPMMTESEKEGVKAFNAVATQYGKIPYEWSLKTATDAQKREYDRVFGQFEKAKEHILKTEQGIIGDKDTLLFVSDIESKIRLNQFFNTHPDAEKQLQSIESDTVWKRALGDIVTERGLYFGAGVATKTFATGLLGAVGFPLAAVGMGGLMARKRATETLREREKSARHGKKDTSNEAANVVTADRLAKKLEDLTQKINSEENETKRAQLLSSLQVRMEYTQNKINDGLVDFGSTERRIVNQYDLMDKLGAGSSTFAVMDIEQGGAMSDKKKDVKGRLDQFLQFKDTKISKAQSDYLRKQMIYGAGLGMGAFFAGRYAKDVLGTLWDVAGPTEAHASAGGVISHESIMKGYISKPAQAPMTSAHSSQPFSPTEKGQDSIMRGYVSKSVQTPMTSAHESVAFGAAKKVGTINTVGNVATTEGVTIPMGAAKAAQEAISTKELFHETLDIGKRGPEGAFIDELKKHPEIAERLGIKDAGKAAHAAWTEFAKQELKDPETKTLLSNLGYPKTQAGYADMMRHIEHGKIGLEESGGKLHMRISEEDTEYLRARPKIAVPVAPRISDDVPTGPQVFGETAPAVTESAPIPAEVITPEQLIVEEIPEPAIDAADTISRQPIEGILSTSDTIPRPSVEVFVDHQFGLDHEEYAAIKEVTVEKLLKQIPSRDEGWAIWRGEVPGKEITLPHDGIYGAFEFKKHLDLAEHIRGLNPDDAAMHGNVDTFMKAEIQHKVLAAPEISAGVENGVPPVAEAQSAAGIAPVEDVPTGPQVFGETSSEHEASRAIETVTSPSLIAPEKLALLNDDIYNSKIPMQKILTQYRVGNITGDDFVNYYGEKVAHMKLSGKMLEDMKKTLSDAAGGSTVNEQFTAQRALDVLIRNIKASRR